jgi:hypothetical protein
VGPTSFVSRLVFALFLQIHWSERPVFSTTCLYLPLDTFFHQPLSCRCWLLLVRMSLPCVSRALTVCSFIC